MDRADFNAAIERAFLNLYAEPVNIEWPSDDQAYVYVGFRMFNIEFPSDDDGFMYAHMMIAESPSTDFCVRIAYPS